MKKFKWISLALIITLLFSFFAACEKDKQEPPTNQELIEQRVELFLTSYNDGDFETVLSCFDAKSRNTLRALFNVLGGVTGSLTGISLDFSDLFSLGVSTTGEDFMKLQIVSIGMVDSKNAIVSTKMNMPGAGTHTIYFEMVYENDGWYICNMTDKKSSDIDNGDQEISNDEDINEELAAIDEAFLTNTTPSEGLKFSLSSDGTYYELTGLGNCKDEHIVIPEYPVEYNSIPVKAINVPADYWSTPDWSNVKYVTIPKSVKRIKLNVKQQWVALNYLGSLQEWCNLQGVSKVLEGNAFLFVNGAPIKGELHISSEIENVTDYAFYGYEKITSLRVTGNTVFGEYSFSNCPNLSEVLFENGANARIGGYGFYNCDTLQRLIVGNDVTEIGVGAFAGCSALNSIVLGNGITTMGDGAFSYTAYCDNLKSWDKGLLYIGNYLYSAKEDVIDLYIKDGTVGVWTNALNAAKHIQSVRMPVSLSVVGLNAFANCRKITSVKYAGTKEDYDKIVFERGNEYLTANEVFNENTGLAIKKNPVIEF